MGKQKTAILSVITLLAIGSILIVDPIPQDPGYHQFADTRMFMGIDNAWNVLSSLLFLPVGVVGLVLVSRLSQDKLFGIYRVSALFFFSGYVLIGLGSGYYHLTPSNHTLLWDRLAMSISFMALFSFILAVHVNPVLAKRLLGPLLIIGATSVSYWFYGETVGQGDLRWYGLVQFLPMVLIPILLLMFPQAAYKVKYVWWLIGVYTIAKVAEHFDHQLFDFIFISGHSLKHLFASLAGVAFLNVVYSFHAKQ